MREGPYRFLPSAESIQRSNRAIYELIGERVRELFVVSHNPAPANSLRSSRIENLRFASPSLHR